MQFAYSRALRYLLMLLVLDSVYLVSAHAQFVQPTKEELAMTSIPEVPGAAAVYLSREETTEDALHMYARYDRIKVLTEAGKKYADVELLFYNNRDTTNANVTDIQGRTIHADGTVIPFTGKPYEKMIESSTNGKYAAKVFTLPDVQVGSIIEYRYKYRYDDGYVIPARWNIQSDLFIRKGHYLWKPVDENVRLFDDRVAHFISWSALLPQGVEVSKSERPAASNELGVHRSYEVNIKDVPPMPEEAYMPPLRNLGFRVWFYYAADNTAAEFWQNMGKAWSRNADKFANADALRDAVSSIVAPTDTSDQKLHKIYAAVMGIENTDFTRARTSSEDKAATGHETITKASDVWQAKRGSSDEITQLFVALVRAAGMKAHFMQVTNRDQSLFLPDFMYMGQLDDMVAIVEVDGKEQFFDPGSRYCPYGHLAWQHTAAHGLRQTNDGTTTAMESPGESFRFSTLQRTADLVMDKDGVVSGPVVLVFSGEQALAWRQVALKTDDAGLRVRFKEYMQAMLPQGLDVQVASIAKVNEYEDKLTVAYSVKGNLGSLTGKRMILPADLFEATAKPAFASEKRITPVYFQYPSQTVDAFRVRFPSGFTIESLPPSAKDQYEKGAVNTMSVESNAISFTVHRDVVMAEPLVPPAAYPALRTYYSKMEQAAQSNIVLSLPAAPGGN